MCYLQRRADLHCELEAAKTARNRVRKSGYWLWCGGRFERKRRQLPCQSEMTPSDNWGELSFRNCAWTMLSRGRPSGYAGVRASVGCGLVGVASVKL